MSMGDAQSDMQHGVLQESPSLKARRSSYIRMGASLGAYMWRQDIRPNIALVGALYANLD